MINKTDGWSNRAVNQRHEESVSFELGSAYIDLEIRAEK